MRIIKLSDLIQRATDAGFETKEFHDSGPSVKPSRVALMKDGKVLFFLPVDNCRAAANT